MVEKLVWFGRLGMFALLYLFLWRLSVVLTQSFDSVATGGQASAGESHPAGFSLRVLKKSSNIWVKNGSGEKPIEVGGIIVPHGSTSFGRGTENDIRLDDPFASASHARLRWQRKGLLLADLNTTNGTRVNGIQIAKPTRLRLGDIIEIGSTSFVVERQ